MNKRIYKKIKHINQNWKKDINNMIEQWHEGDIECHLHDYLGMTMEEYYEFARTSIIPERLKDIYTD